MLTRSDPIVAMAEDSALLAAAEAGTAGIRVFRWDAVGVTLGRHQAPESILVAPIRVPYAQRPTGGGAVLHGHDVTLTVARPIEQRLGVRSLYEEMAQFAVEYLAAHGLSVGLATDGARRTSIGYCFEQIAATDLIDLETGKKVCGCALRVGKKAALLQTSIPYREPDVNPGEIIQGAKWTGAPNWRPRDDFDPSTLAAWRSFRPLSA